MRQTLPNTLRLTILTILLCALVSMTGCGSSNTIILSNGAVRQLSKDVKIKAFVKNAKGERVEVNTIAKAGEFVVGDPQGAKKQPNSPTPGAPANPAPPPADKLPPPANPAPQ